MTEIESLRKRIDIIDREIANLFEKRMETAALIGKIKLENGKNICDKAREEEIIKRNMSFVGEELSPYYEKLLRELITLSKEYQKETGTR